MVSGGTGIARWLFRERLPGIAILTHGAHPKEWRMKHEMLSHTTRLARAIACGTISILAVLSTRQLRRRASQLNTPRMAPIEQHLMEKNAEIALARSAAPEAISSDARGLACGPARKSCDFGATRLDSAVTTVFYAC